MLLSLIIKWIRPEYTVREVHNETFSLERGAEIGAEGGTVITILQKLGQRQINQLTFE